MDRRGFSEICQGLQNLSVYLKAISKIKVE